MGRHKKEVTKVAVIFKVQPEVLAKVKEVAWDRHWTITKVFETCLLSTETLDTLFNDKEILEKIIKERYGIK